MLSPFANRTTDAMTARRARSSSLSSWRTPSFGRTDAIQAWTARIVGPLRPLETLVSGTLRFIFSLRPARSLAGGILAEFDPDQLSVRLPGWTQRRPRSN